MNKKTTLIAAALVVFIAIPVIIWIISSTLQKGTVSVETLVVPSNATVTINDETYSNKNSINLKPGTYTVVTSRDGFETNTQDILVAEGQTNAIIASLLPVSEEAMRWQENNMKAYLELEGRAGSIAAQQGQEFIDTYPITKWLPLQKPTYTIGYRQVTENGKQGIVITINAVEGFREAALQELRDRDIDLGDYTIEFTDYRSPF